MRRGTAGPVVANVSPLGDEEVSVVGLSEVALMVQVSGVTLVIAGMFAVGVALIIPIRQVGLPSVWCVVDG